MYVCPAGQELNYRTTGRTGFQQYASDPEQCKSCPFLNECKQSKNHRRVVTRHIWEDSKDGVRNNRLNQGLWMTWVSRQSEPPPLAAISWPSTAPAAFW
ncbi:transposase [Paenibacillus sp. FSL R10-2736]|uniref:transposase n=1 Tax=Paenibacillus sp. FSL R10-2736 TaxID=2954692 RepID=UPI004046C558